MVIFNQSAMKEEDEEDLCLPQILNEWPLGLAGREREGRRERRTEREGKEQEMRKK